METPDGGRVAFTRSEKRALATLAGNPGRILSRDQILDALAGPGSDARDRNIDFLINRLRRKLSDDARAPRYIATRYGEGYIWIGPGAGVSADYVDAYLVVGPLHGLDNLAGNRGLAERFASDLHGALRSELPPEQRVVLAPDCPPATDFNGKMPSLSVELTFFEERGAVNCIATAREFRSGRILAIRRVAVPAGEAAETMRSAARLARALRDEAWRVLATQIETGVPLPVLMDMASTQPEHDDGLLTDSDQHLRRLEALHEGRTVAAWKENDDRLRRLREADPDDPVLKIMQATHIHAKYIRFGYTLFQAGIDDRAQDEDEIEALVLAALPHVQSRPDYAIMAAKLLYFVDRGYFELARDLSEEAYGSSVSAASSLAIVGQLRAFAGETEAALRCIDQALNLVTPRSKAHLYVLTIKMQALRAVADFDRLQDAKREFFGVSAAAMFLYEPMFANPDRLSLRAKAVTMMLSRDKAAALLRMINYTSARLFRDPEHRANSILTPLTLVARRFGKAGVPDEVAATHPGLLDRFS